MGDVPSGHTGLTPLSCGFCPQAPSSRSVYRTQVPSRFRWQLKGLGSCEEFGGGRGRRNLPESGVLFRGTPRLALLGLHPPLHSQSAPAVA